MAAAGMDWKSLQYIMGHSDANTTMNIYAHSSYEMAEKAMAKVVQSRWYSRDSRAMSYAGIYAKGYAICPEICGDLCRFPWGMDNRLNE